VGSPLSFFEGEFGPMTRPKLFRVIDVAELLGASKQRADRLRRHPDFPAPVDRSSRGDLWTASDIRRWASTHDGGVRR
jgi:predicted DNA-binding transcriptional regulator AlpA